MPRQGKAQAEVACPKCGHRFRLDDRLTEHIHDDWEKEAKQRLRRELREEAEETAEKRVRSEYTKQLREKDEELEAKERRLRRVERQLATAAQKAGQKPAQELGLIRQETLHDLLAARFANDGFQSVAIGRRGADLKQTVNDPSGRACGVILWESKRGYRSWSNGWPGKLRVDQRREGCALGVIVSDVLPDGGSTFCHVGGELACDVGTAPYLAMLLRERLIEVAGVRGTRARRDDLKGVVYDYVSGPFIQYIGSIMEKVVSMKTTLDREQRAKAAEWKQREAEIDGVAFDLAAMYGDLRGIGAALPSVANLELAPADSAAPPIRATPA